MNHGYECRECGHVPTDKELRNGRCPYCHPASVAQQQVEQRSDRLDCDPYLMADDRPTRGEL